MSVNGILVEDKKRGFKGEGAHFSFNKCPIYTHDSASAKFGTNSQETDNSVLGFVNEQIFEFAHSSSQRPIALTNKKKRLKNKAANIAKQSGFAFSARNIKNISFSRTELLKN